MTSIKFSIGTENFQELIENNAYYIDKTSCLYEIFAGEKCDKIPLFIRPRRFGKTLNMSMIKSFCELNYKNPKDKTIQKKLFLNNGYNLAISDHKYEEFRDNFMGEFPVISISLRTIEGRSYLGALCSLLKIVANLYRKFSFLSKSKKIKKFDKESFVNDLAFCAQKSSYLKNDEILFRAEQIASYFIENIATLLYAEFEKKVLVIIDEYDVQLQKATVAEEPYYDKMLEIIRKICITTFKQDPDPWLSKGIVTGCLKIAHQSVFTDANNCTVYGMDDTPYSDFFGFTEDEIDQLLYDCDLASSRDIVKAWYDGYRMGKDRVFCPWSVMQFCSDKRGSHDTAAFEPKPYWVNTSGNDIIQLYLERAVAEDMRDDIARMQDLLNGIPQEVELKEFATYPDMRSSGVDFDTFMTFLLHTGYVTFTDDSAFHRTVRLRIPNREVLESFREKLSLVYGRGNPLWVRKIRILVDNLLHGAWEEVREGIDELFGEFLSIRDTAEEARYHGILLGMLALVTNSHVELASETESGDGFADITLYERKTKTAVILEFKKSENDYDARVKASEDAASQIIRKGYATRFMKMHCTTIYGYGIGFGGKYCEVKSLGNIVQS